MTCGGVVGAHGSRRIFLTSSATTGRCSLKMAAGTERARGGEGDEGDDGDIARSNTGSRPAQNSSNSLKSKKRSRMKKICTRVRAGPRESLQWSSP